MVPIVKFVRTPKGFQSFVSKSGEALTPWKQYKQSEVGAAMQAAKASGWNVNYTEPAVELGNPMLQTTWGNIPTYKRGKLIPRWADYLQADLDNPRHFAPPPAANQYINLEDALSTIDDISRSQIALLGKDKSGGMEMGSYDLMLRRDNFSNKEASSTLGQRDQLISDKNKVNDFYRQELGEYPPTENPMGLRSDPALSDSLPFAPQHTWQQKRNVVRLPNPTRQEALKQAQLNDNAAYLDWQQEQSGLIQQRDGSYNLVVSPNGYRQQVIDEGLFPTQPQKTIDGLYKDGLPWQPTLAATNELELPNSLELEVGGMGRFPFTRGARIGKTPLTNVKLSRELNEQGQPELVKRYTNNLSLAEESLIRDPNEPIMMDAFDAIKEKERLTDTAASRYLAARDNPEFTPTQVLALQQEFETHRQQLATAQRAYAAASRLEPVTNTQNVSLNFQGTNADDALALIQKAGLNIDRAYSNLGDRTTQIQASGSIPIRQHMALASGLGDTYNRQELVLPPDVSIASNMGVFKNAGIAPNTLVRGVEWGKNSKGERVPVTPGTSLNQSWDGQRVRVGRVQEPTVQSIAVSNNPVYESDLEWKQLLKARDTAKRQQREDLVRAVNIKRLERGEPLLVMDEWGNLLHRDPDYSISTADSNQIQNIIDDARRGTNYETYAAASLGEALDNAALSRSAQNIILSQGNSPSLGMDSPQRYSTSTTMPPIKSRILSTGHTEPSIAELEAIKQGSERASNGFDAISRVVVVANPTTQKATSSKSKWGAVGNQPAMIGTDASWDAATPSLEQKIWEARNVAAIRHNANPRMAATASKWGQARSTPVSYSINATVDPEVIYAQHPLVIDAAISPQPQRALPPATVIRPATVDLNSPPPPPPQRTVRFTPVNGGYQTYIDNSEVPTPHKFVTPQDYNAALATAAGKGWNVVVDEPAIDVVASRVQDPIGARDWGLGTGDRTTRTSSPSPQPPAPSPLVEDPANNWNKYVPYAAAVGGLGIGAAGMYALNRQPSQEEEDMRRQMAQQQMMLQMQGRRFG